LKSRTGIIIGAIVILIIAAGSAAVLLPKSSNTTNTSNPQQQTTQDVNQSNQVGITIKTDGNSATVNATSVPANVQLPAKMLSEMKNKAYNDIQSSASTVSSVKADMQNIAKKYNFTVNVTIVSQFGTDQLPYTATVDGTSMLPTLKDGQGVVVLKTNNFKVGDIVIARHPSFGIIVKRVSKITNGNVYLTSDNKQVTTSNTETTLPDGVVEIGPTVTKTNFNGWVPRKNVIGVVKI